MATTYKAPGPVSKEAIAWFKAKKLKPSFSYLETWKEEHARAFVVAKVLEVDVLDAVQKILTESLENGETFAQFKAKALPELSKTGFWLDHAKQVRGVPARLLTIYETNMRVSRATGQWQRIQRTKRALPYLEYALGPAARHRDEHVAWAGTILPVDDPWWDEHMTPNGWGCRCHVIQLTRRIVDRRGGPSKSPIVERRRWKNPLTGKTESIPRGIDPGWNYNPGATSNKGLVEAARAAGLAKKDEERLK